MEGLPSRAQWQRAWQARERRLDQLSLRLNLPLSRLDTQEEVVERMSALLREPAWAA
jgi:hypothetical protein